MSLYAGFIQLGAGLSVGLAGMAAGFAVGIVGDAGVRASAQQPRLFTGMVRDALFFCCFDEGRFTARCSSFLVDSFSPL